VSPSAVGSGPMAIYAADPTAEEKRLLSFDAQPGAMVWQLVAVGEGGRGSVYLRCALPSESVPNRFDPVSCRGWEIPVALAPPKEGTVQQLGLRLGFRIRFQLRLGRRCWVVRELGLRLKLDAWQTVPSIWMPVQHAVQASSPLPRIRITATLALPLSPSLQAEVGQGQEDAFRAWG